jgi:hypothetical protein
MKINTIYKATIFSVAVLLTGCAEKWLEENPPHLISTESLYTSLAGFEAGLNGLYTLVRQEREGESDDPVGGSNFLRFEIASNATDNMCANRLAGGFVVCAALWGDLNSPENTNLEAHFIWLYKIINAANTIINNAENKPEIDWAGGSSTPDENKSRIIGEAKALRAWAYRHLSYLWGDVPLNLQESLGSTIRTDWVRSPVAEVRKQIIIDLLSAEKSIPVEPSVAGKITKGAVQHYLAEMYLVVNKPDSALFWADKVINTPQYSLITARFGVNKNLPGTPFSDIFLEGNANRHQGNTEALWVWQWAYGTVGGEHSAPGGNNIMRRWHNSEWYVYSIGGVSPLQMTVERGGRAQAKVSFTKFAMDLYQQEDDRGSHHIIRKFFILKDAEQNAPVAADRLPAGYSYGDTIWMKWDEDIVYEKVPYRNWPYSRKFDSADPVNPGGATSNKDQPYLRLAETYLIKAEAQLKLNQPDLAAATINVLRQRANASLITAGDVTIDFILDERSRELIFEEHRRYTLLRTHKWIERTRLHNKNGGQHITDRDTIFPIPQIVIDANLTHPMPQNPGWN